MHAGAILFPALPVLPLVFDCFSQSCHAQLSKLLVVQFLLEAYFRSQPVADGARSQLWVAVEDS